MALQCGIVGLPNVGKSTLFNALTEAKALAANYPFATKDPNVGILTVPDPRIDKLAELVNPQNVIRTSVEIVDIAGLIKGASQGEGLGNQFLSNIREVDAIVHVVRCFENDNIVHVEGGVDAVRDKGIIDNELILKDLESLEKRIDKLKKTAKSGDKDAKKHVELAQKVYEHLESENPARTYTDQEGLENILGDLMLLTAKPVLYVCNVDETSVVSGNEQTEALKQLIANEDAEMMLICANIEAELIDLTDPEEKTMFLDEMGLTEPGINRLTRSCYALLDLITYFTAGEKEVRAWPVPRNAKAPEAAGVIHSDFEKGFIRAEVIKYADYVALESEQAVKDAGKLSVEGKEYVVQDGDIMHFRFNV